MGLIGPSSAGSIPTGLLSNPIGLLGLFCLGLNTWADPSVLFRFCYNPMIKAAHFKFELEPSGPSILFYVLILSV